MKIQQEILPTKLREQYNWITLKYAKTPSPTIVKREFVRKYNTCGKQKSKFCPQDLKVAASPQRFIQKVKFLKQLLKQSS